MSREYIPVRELAQRTVEVASSGLATLRNLFKSRLGKVVLGAAVIGAVPMKACHNYHTTHPSDLSDIEFPHDGEHISIKDMSFEEKVAQLYYGSLYGSKMTDRMDRVINHRKLLGPDFYDLTDWATDWLKSDETIGGVHIFRSDARDLDETNRTVTEVMAKSSIPPFVSMDLVGGYTRHIGIQYEEAREYGVPERFIQMAKDRGIELPSQEDLGLAYEKLKTDSERVEFRRDMERYGEAIGHLCRDLGVSINFGPVMDLVEDIDGESFMAKNDETYGEELLTVMVLAFHFQKGFQQVKHINIAPKHFVGTGKVNTNLHEASDDLHSEMTVRDGSILPFKDSFRGTLYTDAVSSAFPLDFRIREARYLEAVVDYRKAHDIAYAAKATKLARRKHQLLEAGIYEGAEAFSTMPPVGTVMVGHAQSFINSDTPGSMSRTLIGKLDTLGFDGISVTDDLSMASIDTRAAGRSCSPLGNGPDDIYTEALASGATMPMLLHSSSDLDAFVDRVRDAIENEEDFNGDGKADITEDMIDALVEKVLDEKARLGLLKKLPDGSYENTARQYLSVTRGFHE